MKLLVTGFGPFGSIAANPSADLAQGCGLDCRVLEVSFRAVDDFVDSGLKGCEALMAIGVNASAQRMALETVARNEIGPNPDALGEVRGPGPIDPRLPANLAATLWTGELLAEGADWSLSTSAGNYLCNYLFYRVLASWPGLRVGFLHVPLFEALPKTDQTATLSRILDALKASPTV